MNFQDISEKIKNLKKDDKTVLVAIDGYGGSGKSTLAGKLKQLLPTSEAVEIDSFIIKEKARDARPWEEVFDRKRLEKQVLLPAISGNKINYQILDWAKNELLTTIKLPKVDYLIIDGITSYHPDIEHYYRLRIWVDTPLEAAKLRGRTRDSGNENEQMWDKWAQCDLDYQKKFHPEQRADLLIHNAS